LKKLTSLLLFLNIPALVFANDSTSTKNIIRWTSEVIVESNSLTLDFSNRILFGGYINEFQKNQWTSNLGDNNNLFSEISNGLYYQNKFDNNMIILSVEDRNLFRANFTDDLMKIVLFGNYDFQGDTLNFDNTNFCFDRFHQIKLGYARSFKLQKNELILKAAFSYLNGNQHFSFVSENGSFYTAPLGIYNDLEYDIKAFATDTANFDLFSNNGNGSAFDFSACYKVSDKKYTIYLKDLGYINWNESDLSYATDTSYSFNGFEIDDLFEFNDSILKDHTSDFIDDLKVDAEKSTLKSYIPASFGFKLEAKLSDNYFNSYETGFNLKWQPYQDNMLISVEKIIQGFFESGYSPYFYIKAFAENKYALIAPQLSIGGYYQKLSLGFSAKFGDKIPISIGSNHIESIFKGSDSQYLNVYLQIALKF